MIERIDEVLARIDAAAERRGRRGSDIEMLLATKSRRPAEIAVAIELLRERGRTIAVGENRAQEIAKHSDPLLADNGVPRHFIRSEEHTSELQSRGHLVCRLLLERKKKENS